MKRFFLFVFLCSIAAAGFGCSDGNNDSDSGVDGGDGGVPTVIEDLAIDEEVTLTGLSGPVDAVVDNRGIPHIYASDIMDAMRVQGYLMARDRMAQLEFLRRAIEGRLAEVAGNLDSSMVEGDKTVRWLGLHRQAQAAYDSMEPTSEEKLALDAFAEGITAHIAEIKAGDASLPGDFLPSLLRDEFLTDWTGVNTLSLARYETYLLSFSGWDDPNMSDAAAAVEAAFPENDPDPRLAARSDLFHDLWTFAPAENAFTQEGFFDLDVRRARRAPPEPEAWRPNRELLAKARPFLDNLIKVRDIMGGPDRGSNNWIVSGAHTASGNPIMANDPHLSLQAPAVWWMNHINTARTGGEWDTMGVSFAGTPGITLGFNRNIAWGATVTNYDVTDVYEEVITPGAGGAPDTVEFNGQQVEIETITEEILVASGQPVQLEIEIVPHHGPIIADTREADRALSMRWVGFEPSNELLSFVEFGTAETVDDVFAAMRHFEVGSQNIVSVDSAGNIGWTTRCHVPVRDPQALTYDPVTRNGHGPDFVLPGTGGYEWIDRIPDGEIPHVQNPAEGWLATANQDPVGGTMDGNPYNDEHFLSGYFDMGHREARIQARLAEMVTQGGITTDDMIELQADSKSPQGTKLASVFVAALTRAEEEVTTPGTHADLSDAVAELGADTIVKLVGMRDRLAAWTSFATPAAVEGDPSTAEIADSVATTIFNVTMRRLVSLALKDELDLMWKGPSSQRVAKFLQFAMLEPERLATYDPAIGDTVLWDDLTTATVEETRDDRIVRAAAAALTLLEARFSTDMDTWRWGELHTIRFMDMFGLADLVPEYDIFSIPPLTSTEFPDGFPRHGDNFVVDASNFSAGGELDFSYGSGPSQRLVVEMTPDGPKAFNALPGGNTHAPGPHQADEAELWRHNEAPPFAYEELEVVQAAERRIHFTP